MQPTVAVLAAGGTAASTNGEEGAAPPEPGEAPIETVPDPESDAERAREIAEAVDGVVATRGSGAISEDSGTIFASDPRPHEARSKPLRSPSHTAGRRGTRSLFEGGR